MGDVPAAVDRYTDIAPEVRERLKARMRAHDYNDIVEISRDRIVGDASYEPQIRDMHFGQGRVCASVSRDRWTDEQRERALVYCEGTACVMVPTVCRNVSRIARVPGSGGGGGAAPPGEDELIFDPPGAGAPTPVPADAPPFASLPPTPLPYVPVTPPGSFSSPPRVSIGPPSGGPPPVTVPTPLFVLPPRAVEIPPPAVPEPSTVAMLVAGLALLALTVRRASSRRSSRRSSKCALPGSLLGSSRSP
ncbi:MHFG family PEP-CTERM protein [Mitsuaria sp. 7]|uniref:MHFG family PEP-CTERM protein n=1 Tax=Mitsuaria sp. 7 TaxID=1658665 RepID=UPI0018D2E385|nr:MHFG family PEP-CTERM protein [Mitsuaria sp. 7]